MTGSEWGCRAFRGWREEQLLDRLGRFAADREGVVERLRVGWIVSRLLDGVVQRRSEELLTKSLAPDPVPLFVTGLLLGEGADKGVYNDAHPIEHMSHHLTMLAYDMNDQPLSFGHGAPLRLRNRRALLRDRQRLRRIRPRPRILWLPTIHLAVSLDADTRAPGSTRPRPPRCRTAVTGLQMSSRPRADYCRRYPTQKGIR